MSRQARLFYLIGPSGAGKDSLMDYLREHLPAGEQVEFARRYITRRRVNGSEQHVALNRDEFDELLRGGEFVLHWQSHGYSYGIGREVREWLTLGKRVVVNGSRAYLAEAASIIPDLVPVHVTVEQDVLRSRLERRGRESAAEIARRLRRASEQQVSVGHPGLVTIDNSGALEKAGQQLLQLVTTEFR